MSQSSAAIWEGFEIHVEDSGHDGRDPAVATGAPPPDPRPGAGDAAVVLLHSSGMSGEQWRRTARALQPLGARTVVPDLLGSGRSRPWPDDEPFRFELDVEVVGRLLQRLGRPVHLVGHSYGGHIALRAASLAPARVLSLALYDPVSFGVLDPGGDRDAFAEMAGLEIPWGTSEAEHTAWLRAFVEYWGGAEAWSRLREAARAEMTRVGWVVHAGARSLIEDRTGVDGYRALTARTLLVTGERSPIAAQRVVGRLGASIPGARVERLPGAGHMGPLTHLEAWNQLLADHLAAARAAS